MDAVVKVYCVHTEPNYSLPWQRKRQENSTSTAFMVAGPQGERWLLTNAHSVDYHTQVRGVCIAATLPLVRSADDDEPAIGVSQEYRCELSEGYVPA